MKTTKSFVNGSQSGLTLVELLITIGIMAILAGGTTLFLFNTSKSQNLDDDTTTVAATLRDAQARSITQEAISIGTGERWAVRFTNSAGPGGFYEIFRGTSYPGAIAYRKNLNSSIDFANIPDGSFKDVFFEKISGIPVDPTTGLSLPATVRLQIVGAADVKAVTIGANGTITY